MGKILFVTNRNVLTTCGELRLIKNRSEVLYNNYGISTDFIALSNKIRVAANNKEHINSGGAFQVYPFSKKNPVEYFITMKKTVKVIEELLKQNEYQAIVFSGSLMPIMAKRIKKHGIPILFDMHGALEDIKEVAKNENLIKKCIYFILFYLDNLVLKRAFKYANGCFVVTKSLEAYLKNKFKYANNTKFYIIPCATSGNIFTKEKYIKYRNKYRKKYKITDEIVFVYSGGTSSWQCLKETLELYKKIKDKLDMSSKLLIFSHDIKKIEKMTLNRKDILIDSYSADEVQKALCAADISFLIRKNNLTNKVAFPNKFLEYVKSGLYIIATPFVEEIAKQIKQYNIGELYCLDGNIDALLCGIKNNINYNYNYAKITEIINNNSFEKKLESFVNDYGVKHDN